MALRLLEITIPTSEKSRFLELKENPVIEFWQEDQIKIGSLFHVLIQAESAESIMDELEKKFSYVKDFRVILLSVDATLPRPKVKEESTMPALTKQEIINKKEKEKTAFRVSREELYTEISDNIRFNKVFIAMVILSTIVAAIGLTRDSLALVIGAMVIAPLLGPNVGLAFATALGDFDFGKKALKTNFFGFIITLCLSIIIGYIWGVDLNNTEISSRTYVLFSDIILALAAGTAGVLALSSGVSTALIGVMVAVALLPPLVTVGLLLGAGYFHESAGAFLLLATNLICVNFAGVMTFVFQGIRPRTWWEAEKAKKTSKYAISLWAILIIALCVIIYFTQLK